MWDWAVKNLPVALDPAPWNPEPGPLRIPRVLPPGRLFSIGKAIWQNAISPIEAVIFQPFFFIRCSRN
jgi:hypothetical protein